MIPNIACRGSVSRQIAAYSIALLLFVHGNVIEGQSTTNQLTDIRYNEEVTRGLRFVRDESAAGFALESDRGVFSMQATLRAEDAEARALSLSTASNTAVIVTVASTDATSIPFQITAPLQSDPRWMPGNKRAHIVLTNTFDGRTVKTATVGVRIEGTANGSSIRVKVQGRYFRQNNPAREAGNPMLATNFLAQPSQQIHLTNATVIIALAPITGRPAIVGQGFMTVTGQVLTVSKTAPGIGTGHQSRVILGADRSAD